MARKKLRVRGQLRPGAGIKGGANSLPIPPEVSQEMSQDLAQYVTTTDAAEMLGVTKKHVALLLERERIRGKKMGRDWLVYIPSINLYFQTKAPGGRPRSGDPTIEAAS